VITTEKSYNKNVSGTDWKKFNFLCFAEILCSCHQVTFCGSYEGDPLSPPKGEATHGEHPLDPPLPRIFINLLKGYRIFGDALAAGAKSMLYSEPPRAIIEENVLCLS